MAKWLIEARSSLTALNIERNISICVSSLFCEWSAAVSNQPSLIHQSLAHTKNRHQINTFVFGCSAYKIQLHFDTFGLQRRRHSSPFSGLIPIRHANQEKLRHKTGYFLLVHNCSSQFFFAWSQNAELSILRVCKCENRNIQTAKM